MSGFRKFLQILLSLLIIVAILIVAATIYPIPYVSEFVARYVTAYQTGVYIVVSLLALALLYFAIAFIWALLAPAKSRTLKVNSEKGQVAIDHETVIQAIRRDILDVKQASNKRVDVKFGRNPEQTKVKVAYAIAEDQPVQTISDAIQRKAKQAAEAVLNTTIKEVKVTADTYNPDELQANANKQGHARVR